MPLTLRRRCFRRFRFFASCFIAAIIFFTPLMIINACVMRAQCAQRVRARGVYAFTAAFADC